MAFKKVVLIFLFFPCLAIAQKKDTVLRYLNENLEFTKAKDAVYIGVSIKKEIAWMLYALYADTTPLLHAYYKDKDLKIKEGLYTLYYPKHRLAKQGAYRNNIKTGNWMVWYENGNLKDSGAFDDNRKIGLWKSWYENGQLSTLMYFDVKPVITDVSQINLDDIDRNTVNFSGSRQGAYASWYENGNPESSGSFENNRMHGSWKWHHLNGALATEEEYKNGMLTNLSCYDSTGKATGELCSISKPAVLKQYGDYKIFIQQHLTWPKEALRKNLSDMVRVRFTITKEGQLQNLEVFSKHEVLKKSVEDLFAYMQDWYPAIFHNRAVDWDEEYIIPFVR